MRKRTSGPLENILRLAAIVTFAAAVAVPLSAQQSRNHFDSDAPMREPGFFDFVSLGAPGEAHWKVVTEFNPPSAPNAVSQILAERPAESIGAALRRNVRMRDGSISLGIKRTPGRGGVVFRMTDEKNYLALLVDPISGEARLVQSRDGRTHELARGKAVSLRDWAVLTIRADGGAIVANWEGKPLLQATDPAPAAGRAGIATAGPGIMTFDEFVVDPAAEKEETK